VLTGAVDQGRLIRGAQLASRAGRPALGWCGAPCRTGTAVWSQGSAVSGSGYDLFNCGGVCQCNNSVRLFKVALFGQRFQAAIAERR
jgi:hypothetical protein